MFFKKKLEKIEIVELCGNIKAQAMALKQMIEFIKDYGNMTKRKKHKLTVDSFVKCRNNITSLPLSLCISMHIINSSKKLVRKYNKIFKMVEKQFERDIKNMKENKKLEIVKEKA